MSAGIPKSDLAASVQTSLGKADTALQTEQYKGTVTGVKINGSTKNPSNGVVDLGTVITEHQDISGKQDKLVSGTNIKTVNGKSILGSGDLVIESGSDDIYYWDSVEYGDSGGIVTAEEFEKIKKCSVLVQRIIIDGYIYIVNIYTYRLDVALSGGEGIMFNATASVGDDRMTTTVTFIPNEDGSANYETTSADLYTFKTINGESILGEGDIVIEGGSGGSSSGGAYAEVNHGTSDTTFTLTPNTFHIWDEVSALTLNLGSETNGIANEFLFQFSSGATATTLTLPDDIKWVNDSAPTIAENMIYQVSILKGLASALSWEYARVTLITFYYNGTSYQAEEGMTWEGWCSSTYNTDGFYILYNNVFSQSHSYVCINYKNVLPADVIIANGIYNNEGGGGGSGN